MKRKRSYDSTDLFVYFSYELGARDADILYNAVALYQQVATLKTFDKRALTIVAYYMTCKRMEASWNLSFRNALKYTGFTDLTTEQLKAMELEVLLLTWRCWPPVRFFVGRLPLEDRTAVHELLEDAHEGMLDFGDNLQALIDKHRYTNPPPRPRKKQKTCSIV